MSATITEVNEASWQDEVLDSTNPVIVDFWAPWCGPCRMVAPVMEELADKHSEEIKVVKLNVDENQNLAAQFNVMSIPTVGLFEEGQMTKRVIGAQSRSNFEKALGIDEN